MSELFFDTETTGLPLWDRPSKDRRQPHLVQLAALVTTNDHQMNRIVSPQGQYKIPPEIVALNGITTERAEDEGVPLREVADEFIAMLDLAEILVAHNLGFDRRIMRIQLTRLGMKEAAKRVKAISGFCTMQKARPAFGKVPKLGEAYTYFTGKPLEAAHTAMADALACREIYQCLTGAKGDE